MMCLLQLRKSSIALIIIGGIIIYLIGDLLIFDGVLHRTLQTQRPSPADHVARVSGRPITRSQLERALNQQLWIEGKSAATLSLRQLEIVRKTALDELIDHELLRIEVKTHAAQVTVSDAEIQQRMQRFGERFESKIALEAAMKSQGIANPQDLRNRLRAHIQQEKLITLRISQSIQVTDDEARKWFHDNSNSIKLPERVQARHIFIATLDHPSDEAQQTLTTALAELTTKKQDFATLARQLSEDSASKDRGGELGWMTRDRLPSDFAAALFLLALNQPQLIHTALGWHLVELTARKTAEPADYEQAKPEILAALEALKRRRATADFRKSLRDAATTHIEIIQPISAD